MHVDIPVLISLAALVAMLYCLWLVVSLKKSVPGGVVGKTWSQLTGLVVLFTLGYLTAPFFGAIAEETLRFIVSLIFFFGAIYVMITIKLIHTVIRELAE